MQTTHDVYRPGKDDSAVMRLRTAVWGADHPHTNPAFFEWLFQRNPAGAGSGAVIRQDDDVVAFAGLSARKLLVGGKTFRVAHGLDLMVDPGLSGLLSGRYGFKVSDNWAGYARDAGFAFGVNFPNSNSFRLLTSGRLKWTVMLKPRLRVQPLRGFAIRPAVLGRVPLWLLNLLTGTLALGLRAPQIIHGKPAGRVVAVTRAEEQLDDLWQSAAHHTKTCFVRDRAYIRWRYLEHPVYRYDLFGLKVDDRLAGLIVTTTREVFGLKSMLIVDALADRDEPAILSALVAHATAKARAAGIEMGCAQACTGDLLDRALAKSGFLVVPERLNPKLFFMVGLPFTPDAASILASPGWHFTWGDMDVV
ncbi:hypothetical protein [Rhizobium sp. LjRoot254]|uniref:hypothetical protein n=1 Tax=Rhizobium sp. LjRoot254 TaxID=3342297 RepID=UPI003ECE738C